jgi:2-polyprenyl-6-hydroxyphenyl methylase/3-demethylubiquinone-9 3-methyltransferase
MNARSASIDEREVEQFARLGAQWWDPKGPMAALHKLNPVRIAYIRDQAAARFERDTKKLDCLKGLRVLDIGCGAGILSEPLARLGTEVTGIDPAAENIEIAAAHARDSGMDVDYRATTAEDLAVKKEQFDIVLAMEVVEHVIDVPAFVATCASMV